MKDVQSSIDTASAISDAASKTTFTGAGAGVFGLLSNMDWVTIIGVAVAVGGFLVNLIFRTREYRLKLEEERRKIEIHELRKMRILQGKCHDD